MKDVPDLTGEVTLVTSGKLILFLDLPYRRALTNLEMPASVLLL